MPHIDDDNRFEQSKDRDCMDRASYISYRLADAILFKSTGSTQFCDSMLGYQTVIEEGLKA